MFNFISVINREPTNFYKILFWAGEWMNLKRTFIPALKVICLLFPFSLFFNEYSIISCVLGVFQNGHFWISFVIAMAIIWDIHHKSKTLLRAHRCFWHHANFLFLWKYSITWFHFEFKCLRNFNLLDCKKDKRIHIYTKTKKSQSNAAHITPDTVLDERLK